MIRIRKYGYVFMVTIFIIIGLFILFLFKQMDSALTPIEFKNNEIKITHKTYKINNIMDVELLDKVILSGGSGSNTPNTNNGDKFESEVYTHKNVNPFIRIKTKDSVIVFNENKADETVNTYNRLIYLIKNSN
ncbi:MAG: hypothetical protein ACRDDE_10885 [Paraclostridium sp.]|uniref:hypothetical protein n=1 Tax=Paraclostridium sp. TaxID=2023273 RepID=UPI003EE5064B